MSDTIIQSTISDALALAKTAEDEAKAAAVTLLTHLANGAEGDVPTITDAAVNDLFTFVPAQYRGSIELFLKPGENALDAVATAAIKTGLGFALNRIAAIPEIHTA
jgi:hypothetical protein